MTDLSRFGTCTLGDDVCVTCGDAGVPVRVLSLHGDIAACEDRTGARADVALEFVGEVRPGDVLLVHAGIALTKVAAA